MRAKQWMHKKVANKPPGTVDKVFGVISDEAAEAAARPLLGVVSAGPLGGPSCRVSTSTMPLAEYSASPQRQAVTLVVPVPDQARYFRQGGRPRGASRPWFVLAAARRAGSLHLVCGLLRKLAKQLYLVNLQLIN